MKLSIHTLYTFFGLYLLVVSCKLPYESTPMKMRNLPEKYNALPDDLQDAHELPQWRSFFTDAKLIALIDTALVNNVDVRLAFLRIDQSNANLRFAKRAYLPTVDGIGGVGVTKFGKYTLDGVGNFDTNKSPNITDDQRIPDPAIPDLLLGVQAGWEVGFAGQLRQRKQAAYFQLLASESGRHFVQTQLVAAIATRYFELLALDNQLKVIRQNLALQQNAMEVMDIQKRGGQINELAIKQFQVQLLRTRALELDTKQQQQVIENELNALLGRFSQPIDRADTLLIVPQMDRIEAGLPISLLANRPDIKAAELKLKATEAELKMVRAYFFPTLNVSGYLALNGFNPAFFFNPVSLAYFGLSGLSAPLFNRNALLNRYRMTAAEQQAAFYEYRQVIYDGVQEVNTSYTRMSAYESIHQLKEQEVDALSTAIQISNDLFYTGYANYLEVLMVRQSALEAQIALLDARKQYLQAYVGLYRSLGGGWQ